MGRAEGQVDRVRTVRKQPAGKIALDDRCIAVANVASPQHDQRKTCGGFKVDSAFEPFVGSHPGRPGDERTVVTLSLIDLEGRNSTDQPHVTGNALLELKSCPGGRIGIGAEAAGERSQPKMSGLLQGEKIPARPCTSPAAP